jgi:hypothetical protein
MDAVPGALREVLPDLLWNRTLLWAFDLPVERVPVADLRWQLALPWWSLDGAPFAVSPDEVRADPRRYREQHERTMAADLSFPVHVLERPNGVLTVLDGVHRLLKADLLGRSTLEVKKLSPEQLDAIACA